MKKLQLKKLSLNKETLRDLSDDSLTQAVGGLPPAPKPKPKPVPSGCAAGCISWTHDYCPIDW